MGVLDLTFLLLFFWYTFLSLSYTFTLSRTLLRMVLLQDHY